MSVGVLTVLLKALHVIFFYSWLDREKDEDEGIPSETEDDKRQLETKAKEMRGERKEKTGIHLLLISQNVFLTLLLFLLSLPVCLSLLVRFVEAERYRDHVSVGGEGAALQGDVGGPESR